jgi:predicted phage terminase large subunit-like protein
VSDPLPLLKREVKTEAEADALIRAAWTATKADGSPKIGVLDSVPILTPGYERPEHLKEMAAIFKQAELAAHGEAPPILALFSSGPQIGKTETGQHAYARWLARHPEDFLAFLAYGQDLASEKSKGIRAKAKAAGVEISKETSASDLWRTAQGGGLLARGLEAGITGQSGIKMAWVDDPYKGRSQVESAKERATILSGIKSNVFSRLGPRTSFLLSHTRWHTDDAIGVIEKDPKLAHRFTIVNVACCEEDGTPIITLGGRDRRFYEQQRALSEHDWWSLYMGRPRPREGKLFKGAHPWKGDFPQMDRMAIGVDFAYSKRTSADWSCAVVMGRAGNRRFIMDVVRKQCTASEFAADLNALRIRYPYAPMTAYIGGTELGVVDLLRAKGVHVNHKPATVDKLSRAIPCSDTWNRGEILVPEDGEKHAWLAPFVGEVADFSGINDDHDDQPDAMVAAHDWLGIGEPLGAIPQPGPKASPHAMGSTKVDPWAAIPKAAEGQVSGGYLQPGRPSGAGGRGSW